MSSGPFDDSIYTSDEGDTYPVKIQPETLGATINGVANAAAPGPADQQIYARVSGARRGYGVFTRTVRLEVTGVGTSNLTVGSVITIPALTQTFYAACRGSRTGTYNGANVRTVGRSPERIK